MMPASSIALYIVTIAGALALVWCVSEFKRPKMEVIAIAAAEGVVCFAAVILAYIYIKTDFIFYFAIGTIAMATILSATFFITWGVYAPCGKRPLFFVDAGQTCSTKN